MLEHLGQVPALQRRGLIERVRLRLDQRQIVQRIRDEHALAVVARMPRDLPGRRTGSRPRRRTPSPGPPGTRRLSAPSSRCSGSGRAPSRRRGPHASRTARAARRAAPSRASISATSRSPMVVAWRPACSSCRARQRCASMTFSALEARRRGDRRHEVGAGVFDQPFNLAFVVSLARAAKRSGTGNG